MELLHIVTRKGKGLEEAEKNPIAYHAPGLFDANTGKQVVNDSGNKPLRYQDVFGYTIVELAEQNEKILGITPAMPTGCSLNIMMDKMPHRAFDVGIAEQHAVTLCYSRHCWFPGVTVKIFHKPVLHSCTRCS